MDNNKHLSENPENINLQQMWKLTKNLWPKSGATMPTAKRNHKGKIVSGPREIKNALSKEYKDRLRTRPVRPDLQYMKKRNKMIFEMKMKLAELSPSHKWEMKDLERALAQLKTTNQENLKG